MSKPGDNTFPHLSISEAMVWRIFGKKGKLKKGARRGSKTAYEAKSKDNVGVAAAAMAKKKNHDESVKEVDAGNTEKKDKGILEEIMSWNNWVDWTLDGEEEFHEEKDFEEAQLHEHERELAAIEADDANLYMEATFGPYSPNSFHEQANGTSDGGGSTGPDF